MTQSTKGPLSGVTVVDLSRILAGPYCTLLMAEMGARVIKVEAPKGGDDARAYGPFVKGKSTYFASVNRGKESIALDLKSDADRAIFGKLLAKWPPSDEIGLLELLAKRGSRLGGNTGQMLLRFLGYDGFVTSKDVVACLRDAGLDVAEAVTSKRDLAKVQAQFNAWADETGLPYTQLSRICAMSIGESYAAERLAEMAEGTE